MYRGSPILRAALSPTNKSNSSRSVLSDKIEQELSRIRILTGNTSDLIHKPVSPRSLRSQVAESEQTLMNEMQGIQAIVTEVITLFQEYRSSIDKQLDTLSLEFDSRVEVIVDDRLSAFREEFALAKISNSASNDREKLDRDRLQHDLIHIKEDLLRLEGRIRNMSQMNCETHEKSNQAIKSIRELLINKLH